MSKKEMAIIKGVGFGTRDRAHCMLWFSVHTIDGSALQCIPADEAVALLEKHMVTEVHELEGKPCIVTSDGSTIRFVDLHK